MNAPAEEALKRISDIFSAACERERAKRKERDNERIRIAG